MSVSTKVASTIMGCPGRGALVGVVGLRDSARRQDSHNERVLVLGDARLGSVDFYPDFKFSRAPASAGGTRARCTASHRVTGIIG